MWFQVLSMPAYPSYINCLHTLVDLASNEHDTGVCGHSSSTTCPITLCLHWRTLIIYWRWCQTANEIAWQPYLRFALLFIHRLPRTITHVGTSVIQPILYVLCFKRCRQFAPHDALHDSADACSQHINWPISSCNGPIPTILGLSHIKLIPLLQSVWSESSYLRFEKRHRYLCVQHFILTRRTVTAAATTTSPHIPICEYFSTNLFANDSLGTYESAVCNILLSELAEQDMRHTFGESAWKSDLLFLQQSTDTWKI